MICVSQWEFHLVIVNILHFYSPTPIATFMEHKLDQSLLAWVDHFNRRPHSIRGLK